jgi:hypothetical protein
MGSCVWYFLDYLHMQPIIPKSKLYPCLVFINDVSCRILLTCIKYLAKCPCPRCYVLKDKVSEMGRKLDIKNRIKGVRVDSEELQYDIALARKWLFEMGLPINNPNMKKLLGPRSLTPVQVRFLMFIFNTTFDATS